MSSSYDHVRRRSFVRVVGGLLATGALVSIAIADEGRGINGGQLVEADSGHVEFIGGSGYELLMFAISDLKKRPLSTNDSLAIALVKQNDQQFRIRLRPDGENFLSARASQPLQHNASIVFIAQLANGARLEAHFTSR
jgi:hypothetical protein